ncbi:MAG TPA: GntR family transcriptional regulator [Steroidobacteraceae bacterium]|nr:GntR family transcriptional regulator [Steroidobacteraceae bacterium]
MVSTPRSRRIRPLSIRNTELTSRRLDKGVTRYYRLYELLSAALQDGTIPPESALPSEPELCVRHGMSRTTVRRALDRLEREGRISRRRGSGTYARRQRTVPRFCVELNALPGILAALESRSTTTTLRFDPAPVPQNLRAMAAAIGPAAYVLERLRFTNRQPLALTTAYLPETVASRLRRPIPRRATVMTVLGSLGCATAAVRCTLGAVPADAAAARALDVPLGSPLLRVRAVLTGDAGEPWAVLESLCRSDRLQLKVLERG